MIILKYYSLQTEDLFEIEKNMIKVSDNPYDYTLDYSLLNKPRGEVYGFIGGLLNRMNIAQTLGVSTSNFLEFLMDVEKRYNDNPYHSFYHSVDVVMVIYHFLECYDVSNYLTRIDILILVVAAFCHDVGHPGMNNQFEVAVRSKLAREYEDLSVLESNSCKITLELLDKHNLVRNIETKSEEFGYPITQKEFKEALVKAILATDMNCHFALQHNLSMLSQEGQKNFEKLFEHSKDPFRNFEKYFSQCPNASEDSEGNLANEKDHSGLPMGQSASEYTLEERQMLCKILIHAADISNPCRPWTVFCELSRLVCIEFFRQAQEEKRLGLNPHLSHNNTSKINVGFIDFIVYPYFEILSQLFPKAQELLDTCSKNREECLENGPDEIDLDSPVSIHSTLGKLPFVAPPGTVKIPRSVEIDVQRKRQMNRSLSYSHSFKHNPICVRRVESYSIDAIKKVQEEKLKEDPLQKD
ncbi:hypothetical protein BY458DRAFT_449669 [Sporodiniella umbellata]|nr:hypothetical protein BY458DRAFT_449669 [Sporodiniella umbellata]